MYITINTGKNSFLSAFIFKGNSFKNVLEKIFLKLSVYCSDLSIMSFCHVSGLSSVTNVYFKHQMTFTAAIAEEKDFAHISQH